jgi:hypothetical protein
MKKFRIAAIMILAIAMIFGLASCASSETAASEPEVVAAEPAAVEAPAAGADSAVLEALIADQWCYKFSAEGYGDFAFFFKFYEEDPVLGKVYYAGLSNNRQNFAGGYDLVEEPYEYKAYYTRAEEQADNDHVAHTAVGTAPYTIILKDWDGNEMGRMGFDGEYLYNAQDKATAKIYSSGSTPFVYTKNTGSFDQAIDGEMPVAVFEYVADDDVTSTVQVNHNHTYTDLVAAMIEGTWAATQEADGSITFAFTPEDPTDTAATLVVSADKATAVYTAEGEDPINMSVPKPAVTVDHTFEGTSPTSYGKDATLVIECLSDGTFSLKGTVFGQTMEFDKGTWSMNASHKFTFNCEKAGTLESAIVERSVRLVYKQSGTVLGDLESEMIHK